MQSLFHSAREYLTPILTESSFEEKGVLTPDEFVKAGDLLVYKCPTWRWESGDKSSLRSYLPVDKQYLVTRNVPCRRRVTSLDLNYQTETAVEGEEDWIAANSYAEQESDGHISTAMDNISLDSEDKVSLLESNETSETKSKNMLMAIVEDHYGDVNSTSTKEQDSINTAPDLLSFEEDNLVENDDESTLQILRASEPDDDDTNGILYTRTYDISITYDKYYQTPRVWLYGYNEQNQPLQKDEIFEDIMQDYANQTVTLEPHPHRPGLIQASIHPCQHASVMKRIIANLKKTQDSENGETQRVLELRSDQYLFLFLKFIQSVVPTIDYDHTIEVNAQ